MSWWQSMLLGAAGGAVVEVLAIFQAIALWGSERRTPTGRVRSDPPPLRQFVDLPVHAWLLPLRLGLGGGAATLFVATGQITGVVAAVALGYAAPTVLAQLGQFPQVKALVESGGINQPNVVDTISEPRSVTLVAAQSEEVQQ